MASNLLDMKESTLFVASSNEQLKQKALTLAKKIKLPFAGNLESLKQQGKSFSGSSFLVVAEDLIYLKKELSGTSQPIFCDFLKWNKESKKSNLIKTMRGLPKPSVIIDATAGLGKDALVLSSLVEKIILIEIVPWVSVLLEDGIKNSRDSLPDLMHTHVICSNAKKFLLGLKFKPEAIYLDPMFENTGKSKAKREVQALRDLTVQTDEEELFKVALKKAKDRVVVKRHKKAKNLGGIKPTFSLKGRVVRYDVYSLKLS